MLLLSEHLQTIPIMSLQTGSELAKTSLPIIDPKDLSVIASYVEGPGIGTDPRVLFMSDIREAGELGYIVDDSNSIMTLEGLVRLQAIVDEHFDIIGMLVVDNTGEKIGKVEDFSFNPNDFMIYQLFVKTSILRGFLSDTRIIHRTQIIDVTPQKIIVETPNIRDRVKSTKDAAALVNPFRAPGTETR
ncbi:MAG: PRC-barrel domain-containing protein [Candidatus Saccharimonadales bacterium]